MSALRPSFLLPLAVVLVVMSSAGLRPAQADAKERVFRDREIVAADLAPASFGQVPLLSGYVTLREDGYGYGTVTYGVRGQRPVARIRLDWRERGRVELTRTHSPGGIGLGVWWSPTHQVKVTVEDMNTRDGLDLGALLQLARNATVNLRSRALPWPATIRSLDLARDIHEYRLAGILVLPPRAQEARASVTYAVPERNWRDVAERVQHYRLLRFDIDWGMPGVDPNKHKLTWNPHPSRRRATELGVSHLEYIWSATHFVRIELRGEYYDENRKHRQAFIDAAHLARGREIANRLIHQIEALAQPRGAALQPAKPAHFEDRPAAEPDSGRGSGTIASSSGRFTLIRGGRRVNVVAGGRIQMGDTIIVSGSGALLIRFDDPTAGQGRTGQLAIAPGTTVRIDVPPHRPGKARVAARVSMTQGAVRLARPHHVDNPPVEIQLPGNGGIFGLEGTDVVAVVQDERYFMSVREGRVSRRVGNRIVERMDGGTTLVVALSGEVAFRGPVSEAQYRAGNKQLGLPPLQVAKENPTRSAWQLVPRAGDKFLTEYSSDLLQRRLSAFQQALRSAEESYASLLRRLPTLPADDAEDAIWDTEELVDDALFEYRMLRIAFPRAAHELREYMLGRYLPAVRAAKDRLEEYSDILLEL